MAQDEEYSIFLEVVMCFHPTDYDQTGVHGVYVKEVKLDPRSPTLRAPVQSEQKPTCSKDDEHDHMRNDLGLSECPVCGVGF